MDLHPLTKSRKFFYCHAFSCLWNWSIEKDGTDFHHSPSAKFNASFSNPDSLACLDCTPNWTAPWLAPAIPPPKVKTLTLKEARSIVPDKAEDDIVFWGTSFAENEMRLPAVEPRQPTALIIDDGYTKKKALVVESEGDELTLRWFGNASRTFHLEDIPEIRLVTMLYEEEGGGYE